MIAVVPFKISRTKWLKSILFLAALLKCTLPLRAAVLFHESFNHEVADFSPIGGAPGWRAIALQDGSVTDFSTTTPGDNYPNLSHSEVVGGVGDGIGCLVLGSGRVVSNVLVWTDCQLNLAKCDPSTFTFYSKNDLAAATAKIAVHVPVLEGV